MNDFRQIISRFFLSETGISLDIFLIQNSVSIKFFSESSNLFNKQEEYLQKNRRADLEKEIETRRKRNFISI